MSDQPTTKAIVKSLQSHSFVATSCFWGSVACFSTMSGYGTAGGIFFGITALVFSAGASARADDLRDGARVATREVNKLRGDIRHLKAHIDHLVYQKTRLEKAVLAAGTADENPDLEFSSAGIRPVPHRGRIQ